MWNLVLLKPHIKTQCLHTRKKKRVIKPQNIWLYNQTCSFYLTDLIINSFIETLTTRGKIVRNSRTYSNSQFIDVKKAVNCSFLLKKKTNFKDNSLFYFNSKESFDRFWKYGERNDVLIKMKGRSWSTTWWIGTFTKNILKIFW